jgi:hypothetical protein
MQASCKQETIIDENTMQRKLKSGSPDIKKIEINMPL